MGEKEQSLISLDTCFVSNGETQEEVFKEISKQLYDMKFVDDKFLDNLCEREKEYPTGIDLQVLESGLPNIAVPHTEPEFVFTRRIVPVKLTRDVEFHNMIDPQDSFKVRFLFMILNDSPEAQTNILAQIMDFITQTNPDELKSLFDSTDKEEIYKYLSKKF